jgi:hypothetical protein
VRRVRRYQRSNQNPWIEGKTTQWPKEKGQKDKQPSTKHTHKTKDRLTRTLLKTEGWSQVLHYQLSAFIQNQKMNSIRQQKILQNISPIRIYFNIKKNALQPSKIKLGWNTLLQNIRFSCWLKFQRWPTGYCLTSNRCDTRYSLDRISGWIKMVDKGWTALIA